MSMSRCQNIVMAMSSNSLGALVIAGALVSLPQKATAQDFQIQPLDCWTEEFTWFDCCHPSLGSQGNSQCWHDVFTFDACCGGDSKATALANSSFAIERAKTTCNFAFGAPNSFCADILESGQLPARPMVDWTVCMSVDLFKYSGTPNGGNRGDPEGCALAGGHFFWVVVYYVSNAFCLREDCSSGIVPTMGIASVRPLPVGSVSFGLCASTRVSPRCASSEFISNHLVSVTRSRFLDYSTRNHLQQQNGRFVVDILDTESQPGKQVAFLTGTSQLFSIDDPEVFTSYEYVRSTSFGSAALFMFSLIVFCFGFCTVLTFLFNLTNPMVRAVSLHSGWLELTGAGNDAVGSPKAKFHRPAVVLRVVLTCLVVFLHTNQHNWRMTSQRSLLFLSLINLSVRVNTVFTMLSCYLICAGTARADLIDQRSRAQQAPSSSTIVRRSLGFCFRFGKDLCRKWTRLGPTLIVWTFFFIYITSVVPLLRWKSYCSGYYNDHGYVCSQPAGFLTSVFFVHRLFNRGDVSVCHNVSIFEVQFHAMAILFALRCFVTSDRIRFCFAVCAYVLMCVFDISGRFAANGIIRPPNWVLRDHRDLFPCAFLVQAFMSAFAILRSGAGKSIVPDSVRTYFSVRVCCVYLVFGIMWIVSWDFVRILDRDQVRVGTVFGDSISSKYLFAPITARFSRGNEVLCKFFGWRFADRILEFPFVLALTLWLDVVHTASTDYSVPIAGKYETMFAKLSFGVNVCHPFVIHLNKGYFHPRDLDLSVFNFCSVYAGIMFVSCAVSILNYLIVEHPIASLHNAFLQKSIKVH